MASLVQEYDVLIAGAGPAGIGAAISAARNGARTLLIEQTSCSGGAWTSANMNLVFDFYNKNGIIKEIKERLVSRGAWSVWNHWKGDEVDTPAVFPVEEMKYLLDCMLSEAGVEVRYQTILVDADVVQRRINNVTTASKSGIEKWKAKYFIDATGDGDLAARSGCTYYKGRDGDGKMQPGTMHAIIDGWQSAVPHHDEVIEYFNKIGYSPSYKHLTLFTPEGYEHTAYFMATHLYGLDGTDANSYSEALINGRKQIMEMVGLLRDSGDPRFENIRLLSIAPQIGIREGRRIKGHYYITIEDLRQGSTFEDGICLATFNVDVHHVDPQEGTGLWAEKVPAYQIPYRCLVAYDIDNLLLAGRLISGDSLAFASYRVTANCTSMGEAAGKAAALCAKESVHPMDVDVSLLQKL